MKHYAPHYYTRFKCIADKCRHSCCIGWEIDIDSDTLELYQSIPGEFGQRLRDGIQHTDEGACFALCGESERCPFLNSNGLCDIIIKLGEPALCQICSDHPRFVNVFSDRMEIGLGLCCEAAGELILNDCDYFELTAIAEDSEEAYPLSLEEAKLLDIRNRMLEILQSEQCSISERWRQVAELTDTHPCQKTYAEWANILMSLERLDESWEQQLNLLYKYDCSCSDGLTDDLLSHAAERLSLYFIYRHLADALYDGRLTERIALAYLSVNIITTLCIIHRTLNGSLDINDIAEIARLYSAEIEYSQENIDKLLDCVIE